MGAVGIRGMAIPKRIIWTKKNWAVVMGMLTGASGIYFPLNKF